MLLVIVYLYILLVGGETGVFTRLIDEMSGIVGFISDMPNADSLNNTINDFTKILEKAPTNMDEDINEFTGKIDDLKEKTNEIESDIEVFLFMLESKKGKKRFRCCN